MSHTRKKFQTIIVGAGAAGLMTAISAGIHGAQAKEIVLLNATPRIGLKILMSGGGRCNITNDKLLFEKFYGESKNALKKVILQFSPKMMIDFLQNEGLQVKVEQPWHKYFPADDRAQSVLDILLKKLDKLGIDIIHPVKVENFSRENDLWQLETDNGSYQTDNLVLACGGFSYPHTGSDGKLWEKCRNLGINMCADYPALTPIEIADSDFRKLSGIAHTCLLSIKNQNKVVYKEENPVLFTHFGLSGPAILNISQWFTQENDSHELCINFLPTIKEDEFTQQLLSQENKLKVVNFLATYFPRRLAETIISPACDLEQTIGTLTKNERKAIVKRIFHFSPKITGHLGYKKAEVTGGGIPFSEIDLKTMELKRFSHLYAVGEIINIHGEIGGYNFQWSWSSGWVCGKSLAKNS